MVDDDASVRDLMAAMLERIGHVVNVAPDGQESLAFLRVRHAISSSATRCQS